MPQYQFPIIVTVSADDYNAAYQDADYVRKTLIADGIKADHADYEYDNEGQRVVYLHPENTPLDDELAPTNISSTQQ